MRIQAACGTAHGPKPPLAIGSNQTYRICCFRKCRKCRSTSVLFSAVILISLTTLLVYVQLHQMVLVPSMRGADEHRYMLTSAHGQNMPPAADVAHMLQKNNDLARYPAVAHEPGVAVLTSFRFCSPLVGSEFYDDVYIDSLGGSIRTAWAVQVADKIDVQASELYTKMMSADPAKPPLESELRRFTCLIAAHASNSLINITNRPLLKHLNPAMYYSMLSITKETAAKNVAGTLHLSGVPHKEASHKPELGHKNCKLRPHYKIAFLILMHERLDLLKIQLDALYDPDALFIYHIDARRDNFKNDVVTWLNTDPIMATRCNILVMENTMEVYWGHGAIVLAQFEGFFQLLEIAKWDHVINISGYDYPLKTVQAMIDILKINPQNSYIYWFDEERPERLSVPLFALQNRKGTRPYFGTHRNYVLRDRFRPLKHSQWMILSYDFVEKMRSHPGTYDLFSWIEFSWIPDEMFFATWAMAPESPINNTTIVNESKRYVKFLGRKGSPEMLTIRDVDNFDDSHFFARKIDPVKQPDLIQWIEARKSRPLKSH